MSADRNTKIKSDQIADYTLLPTDLNATNAVVDNYVPSYDQATGKFTWVAVAGGVSQLSDLSDVGVTTPTNKNVLIADGDSWESRALLEADISDLGSYLLNLVEDTTPQLGGDLDLNGFNIDFPSVANISDVKDEDDMASDSATMLATQQSIKKYVDDAVPDLSTSVDDFTIKYESNKLKVADRIEYNIMLLAFYRAVDNSKSIFNLLDGFIDEYEDETGVDTGASTNEDYDSTNDLYKPTSLAGGIDTNTKLMIHANDGDSSGQAYNITYNGTAKIDATTKKWNYGSLWLDGDSDYLTIPDSTDWDIFGSNSDNWTIDFWVKHTDHVGGEVYVTHYQDANNFWRIGHSHGSGLQLLLLVAGGWEINIATGEITDTNWHHIALIKVANEYAIYKDGIQIIYKDYSVPRNFTGSFYMGQSGAGAYYFDGNIDGIRIQHDNSVFNASPLGVAETGYPDTIVIPTSAPTASANTKLLLNFEEGDNYAGHDVEPQGTAYIDKTTKKWGNGAWKFDGDSDYLELPDSADWDIVGSNSDNWTIDFWVKHTDHSGGEYYFSHYESGTNRWNLLRTDADGIIFYVESGGSGIINFNSGAGNDITDTNWHHLALIKKASEYGIYKDGVQIAYVNDPSIDTFAGNLYIGQFGSGSGYFDGYMDEIRIQHSNKFNASPLAVGVTGYPDTITVPTGEYSEVTTTYNMTLISNSQTADASPSDARIVIFEEDVDSITLNTDIKVYVTRENGTGATWEQVTLADEGNYEGSKRVLSGIVDLDVTGMGVGTDVAYKIETLNNKDLKIHGIGMNWD